jgi:hypothetical protein
MYAHALYTVLLIYPYASYKVYSHMLGICIVRGQMHMCLFTAYGILFKYAYAFNMVLLM